MSFSLGVWAAATVAEERKERRRKAVAAAANQQQQGSRLLEKKGLAGFAVDRSFFFPAGSGRSLQLLSVFFF